MRPVVEKVGEWRAVAAEFGALHPAEAALRDVWDTYEKQTGDTDGTR